MHVIIICVALALAITLRLIDRKPSEDWTIRWQYTLCYFLIPPLLLMMTVLAVLIMGPHGQMVGLNTGRLSYLVAVLSAFISLGAGVKLVYGGWKSLQTLRHCPQIMLNSTSARVVENPLLFCAQIGFWHPQLVISTGMLETLTPEHLEAVIAHEKAHRQYHDTFWFFWLGWIRRITFWLPNTDFLWQELLMLREIRADQWAARQVDPLVIAEALLTVVSSPMTQSTTFCAAFSDISNQRLEERIDAILDSSEWSESSHWWSWYSMVVCLLPLLVIPFHS